MAAYRLPTLNRRLNDEKKLSGAKDNKNKLVVEFLTMGPVFQCTL